MCRRCRRKCGCYSGDYGDYGGGYFPIFQGECYPGPSCFNTNYGYPWFGWPYCNSGSYPFNFGGCGYPAGY